MAQRGDSHSLVPEFRVSIGGSELPPQARGDMVTLAVHEDIDAAGMFTLELINWDMANLQMTWVDDELFREGSEVEIEMGYVDRLEKVISGEITGLEPAFAAGEVPTLTVRGYDRRHRLLRGRKTRSFTEVKDSDIASQIAGDLGLSAEVEDTTVVHDYLLQHNQSDWAFLQSRARRIGFEVLVQDKTLLFRPRPIDAGEVLTLEREADLLAFHPRLTTLGQVARIRVRGWNMKEKEPFLGEAATGDETSTMGGEASGPEAATAAFDEAAADIVDRPLASQAEADQFALGQFNEMALGYVSGEGVCIGRTDLRAGTVVNIEGVGQRFSGLYYVTSTTHSFSPRQGYRTSFTVRRNAA